MLAQKKAVVFALCNAVLIAIYTVVDAKGARLSGHVLQYAALLFALDGCRLPFWFCGNARVPSCPMCAGAGVWLRGVLRHRWLLIR